MRYQQDYKIGNSTLIIKFGDIATATTQVIVTSDDQNLSMGGGTSASVRKAAGESVYLEAQKLIPVPLAGVRPTSSGKLSAKGVMHIFHVASIPSASDRAVADPKTVVHRATKHAIEMVMAMQLNSIALPALGTGFAKFDAKASGISMAETIQEVLTVSPQRLHVEIWLWMENKRETTALTFLSEITERAHLKPNAIRSHAVVLIHGIRTAAGWRQRIGDEIEAADTSLTPVPVGYEFFDVIRFLLPKGPWRRWAAKTVWRKMKDLHKNPNISQVSVIAHSFGTWIVGYLLENEDLDFHRVVLCGAVLDTRFDWDQVKKKIVGPPFQDAPNVRVVNDCGTRDIWPIFAKFATWGYGVSGRWGFQNSLVRDRFHNLTHGDFFNDGFATTYWVPALTGTTIPKGINYGIDPPRWVRMLTLLKLPYLVLLGVAIWLTWHFLR